MVNEGRKEKADRARLKIKARAARRGGRGNQVSERVGRTGF